MTLFEWMTIFNSATLALWIILQVRKWYLDRLDLDAKVLALAENYPAGVKKLTARMGWTDEQMAAFLESAKKRINKP